MIYPHYRARCPRLNRFRKLRSDAGRSRFPRARRSHDARSGQRRGVSDHRGRHRGADTDRSATPPDRRPRRKTMKDRVSPPPNSMSDQNTPRAAPFIASTEPQATTPSARRRSRDSNRKGHRLRTPPAATKRILADMRSPNGATWPAAAGGFKGFSAPRPLLPRRGHPSPAISRSAVARLRSPRSAAAAGTASSTAGRPA